MKKGFTLVEMLVAVSIFSMVMLMATGSVFSIVEANKKTHSIKSVMTNLNFALESMARDIRVGLKYRCTNDSGDNNGVPADCGGTYGGSVFSYKANRDLDGDGYSDTDRVKYWLSGGRIMRQEAFETAIPITAAEITVDALQFYVEGSPQYDSKQPKVVMVVRGSSGTGKIRSEFNIQTTISQRSLDT